MDLSLLLISLGLSGFFASRAFLPAFATACVIRFGDALPILKNLDFIRVTGQEPVWFTNDYVLITLGVLAALELAGDKIPEAQDALNLFGQYLKPILAGATTLGLIGSTDRSFIELIVPAQAGILDLIPALIVAGATWLVATIRGGMLSLLIEADEGDELGARAFLSWAEDAWVLFGIWILIIFPVFLLLVFGIVYGIIFLLQKRAQAKEKSARIPCSACGAPHHPSALACPKCGHTVAHPQEIGFFGQALPDPIEDKEEHAIHLASKKRCPNCATRLTSKDVDQTCKECGTETFADPNLREAYVGMVNRRLPWVLVVCFLWSLIPVLGLIIGVVYYRFSLVAPFRRYLGFGRSILARTLIRLLFLILVFLQWIPLLGGLVVPLMALINFTWYRRSFRSVLAESYH